MDSIRELILSPLFGGPPYLAFASLLAGTSIGFPFSSDVILITGGVFAGTGIFDLGRAIAIALCAILFGDSLAFFAGRKFGSKIVQSRIFRRVCSAQKFEEISGFLNQNASKFIFMVRFTPGARSVIFLTAGTVGVPASTFYKMNFLSTSFYVPTVMTIACLAANRADQLVAQFQAYNRSIMVALILVIAGVLLYRRRKKRVGTRIF